MEKDCCHILMEEHKIVLGKLDKLKKSIDNKDNGKMKKNINSLERDFELHSLNKEEKVLFPVIEEFIPREGGPVGVMLFEHEDLKNSIKEFKKALKSKDQKKLNEVGNRIISVFNDHISKEDNILFPMAHMHLSKEQHEKIIKGMEKIEKKFKD